VRRSAIVDVDVADTGKLPAGFTLGTSCTQSATCVLLALVTLVWNDWIEIVFNVDPDAGDGSLETIIVRVLVVATVVCGWLARTEWRRTQTVAQATIR